jgi:hypothetical protein
MLRWLCFLVLLSVPAVGQDCSFTFTPTGDNNSTAFNNATRGCAVWGFSYKVDGFSAISVEFQAAPEGGGNTPGAWSTFGGTTIYGTNPGVATDQDAWIGYGYYPWLRISVSGTMGTGSATVQVVGCRLASACTVASLFSSGGGGPSANVNIQQVGGVNTSQGQKTMANSWPVVLASDQSAVAVTASQATASNLNAQVVGVAAEGAAASGNPLRVAGVDQAGVLRTLRTNQNASFLVNMNRTQAQAQADGLSNTQAVFRGDDSGDSNPINKAFDYRFNGSTWDRSFTCPSTAAIQFTAAGSGATQIIAASGSTVIRICHVSWTTNTASVNSKLVYGTGSNCGTGTNNLTGFYYVASGAVAAVALDPAGTLRTPASQAVCLNVDGATDVGGVVTYAQF